MFTTTPPCSGSTSWPWPLVALAACPLVVSAAPSALGRRGQNDGNSDGSISMSVWLPILIVSIVFILFSLCTCVRRCAGNDPARTANRAIPVNTSATGNTPRPRRRPQRTPSQVSTKSLPAYMKEPGDQELVLFRGPADEDVLQHAMPMLAEDDEGHHELHNSTFDVPLNRIESVDTMADSSTTNLIRNLSQSVPRPPELHHATMPHAHRRTGEANSLGSTGSEAELLSGHRRLISVDGPPDPRGETPTYAEAIEARMTTVSLNDPDVNETPVVPAPSHTADATAGRARSRFSFLMHNPFGAHNTTGRTWSNESPSPSLSRPESPALRSGSALTRFSSRESHESHHSRTPSRNNLSRTHTRSNSNLFRAFRPHSPGLHAGSSTISLDNISAPLTHTTTHAEFYAPKGGLLTPEQIKLITSREALEKFGVPYGPDAVAAFSLSRERLAQLGPPPEFESVAGREETGPDGAPNAAVETEGDTPASRPASLSSRRPASHRTDDSDVSFATAHDESGGVDETARREDGAA